MPEGNRITSKFIVNRAKDNAFVSGGLRDYREYRDLGIDEATSGAIKAHIVRTTKSCPPGGSGVHYHDLEFQMVYVLAGRSRVWFEGEGEFELEKGDCWIQPPSIRHRVLDFSENYEVLEITVPAQYDTVAVER